MNKEDNNMLNGSANDDFDRMIEITSKLKVPSSAQGKEAAWDKLMQSIEQNDVEEVKTISMFSSRKMWYSVAATLLVVIAVSSLVYRYSMVEFQLSKGDLASRILPDGSEVKMNADSKIEYRKYGWLSNREIKLTGEAFFTVKHGNRFIVTDEFNRKITVTGTKFNVFSRGGQFEVKCFEGSVIVETLKSKPITLTKGNGISFKSKIEEAPEQIVLDSINEPTWIKGEFYFNNSSLKQVFDELSRQFNIIVKPSGVDFNSRKYTGSFKRERIIEALDLICIPMGLNYQISPDSTIVTVNK